MYVILFWTPVKVSVVLPGMFFKCHDPTCPSRTCPRTNAATTPRLRHTTKLIVYVTKPRGDRSNARGRGVCALCMCAPVCAPLTLYIISTIRSISSNLLVVLQSRSRECVSYTDTPAILGLIHSGIFKILSEVKGLVPCWFWGYLAPRAGSHAAAGVHCGGGFVVLGY